MRKQMKYMMLVGMLSVVLTACAGSDSARNYYKVGMQSLEKGDYEIANTNFNKAIEMNQDKAEYYLGNGTALIKLAQYEEAVEEFEKAIVDMESAMTKKNKKKALRGQGIAYYSMGDWDKAIAVFVSAKELDVLKELNTDINYYLADCYMKKSMYTSAIEVYDEMIVEDAKEAQLYVLRGTAYVELGENEQGKTDLLKAVELDSKNYTYYAVAYEAFLEMGDEETAAEMVTQAATLTPKTEQDQYYVALINYYLGHNEEAIQTLQTIEENYTGATALLAQIYMEQEEYELAIEYFLQYIEKNETNGIEISSKLYYELARCYVQQEQYDLAYQAVSAGLVTSDKECYQELKYQEILVLEHMADFDQAYKLAKQYVEEYPEDEQMQRELVFLETRRSDNSN